MTGFRGSRSSSNTGPTGRSSRFDRFAHVERDRDVPLHDLIDRFEELRADSLSRLGELVDEDDLDRKGIHPSWAR
jgi:hypothetical protein